MRIATGYRQDCNRHAKSKHGIRSQYDYAALGAEESIEQETTPAVFLMKLMRQARGNNLHEKKAQLDELH